MRKIIILMGGRKFFRFLRKLRLYGFYVKDYLYFIRKQDSRFEIKWKKRYPCLEDATKKIGFDRHYLYHTAWATRRVLESQVKRHVDISSSLYFVTQLSASVDVFHYDFREPEIFLPGLRLGSENLFNLSFESNSIDSLSCMHVLEHVGLGRYGDPIDPKGDLKAISELIRVLSRGGVLYVVVPVGERSQIFFNAHRSYNPKSFVDMFSGLRLLEFSLLKEKVGGIQERVELSSVAGEEYACGMFIFRKDK